MSASAFLAGVAVGGVRYGYVKFQLHERENVVQYSVDAVKQHFRGQPKVRLAIHSRPLLHRLFGDRKWKADSFVYLRIFTAAQ